MGSMGFWQELKSRHVYRVAAAYAVVGWLLVQVVTQVFPVFHLPNWIDQAVVLVILVGFPIALVLAWAFDVSPAGGLRRINADGQLVLHEGRHGTLVVGMAGVLIAALAGAGYWSWHRAPAPSTARSPDSAAGAGSSRLRSTAAQAIVQAVAIPAKFVAVLPFLNESGDKDQQYFSDGLSEDLITALSQFAGLKVISRDSAFQFRHSSDSSAEIGRKLGVAHLLEGSVRRAGKQVRVTAELVNAADGATVWSQHYDRPYQDLFKLQDSITQAVAAVLKTKLITSGSAVVQSDRPPSGSLAAYNAYLQGHFYSERGTEAGQRKAIEYFDKAVKLDPRYARAYAALSHHWNGLANAWLGGRPAQQAYDSARAAADTALALDPNLAAAHLARAAVLLDPDFDWIGSEAESRRALQLAPNDSLAKYALARRLAAFGHLQRAIDLTRQSLATNPRFATGYDTLSQYLLGLGRLDEAEQAIRTSLALQPGSEIFNERLAVVAIVRGDPQAALRAAQRSAAGPWQGAALALAQQAVGNQAAADAALQTPIDKYADSSAYQIAEVYALHKDPDNVFKWLDQAWANRDPGIAMLLYDPFILRYKDDPRFAAFCRKIGLPTTTDANAMP